MPVGALRTIVVDCNDPVPLAAFWCAVLGVEIHHQRDDWISLLPVETGHPRVAFQKVPETKVGKNRLHLDVWVEDIERATLEGEALGATRVGPLMLDPGEPFQVMLDPAGNEFCFVHAPDSDGP
jgi:catechol 2,3-dioxygenase-like lactoylglutathione lyase family enzyme